MPFASMQRWWMRTSIAADATEPQSRFPMSVSVSHGAFAPIVELAGEFIADLRDLDFVVGEGGDRLLVELFQLSLILFADLEHDPSVRPLQGSVHTANRTTVVLT